MMVILVRINTNFSASHLVQRYYTMEISGKWYNRVTYYILSTLLCNAADRPNRWGTYGAIPLLGVTSSARSLPSLSFAVESLEII
jgi:hypothetical protein